MNTRSNGRATPPEPFAWAPGASVTTGVMMEGARTMSLLWSIPLRTFMVVLGEATADRRSPRR